MPEKPILSVQEIEKIKAEELLRLQIRNELTPKEKGKNKFWTFLNSSVGIWLLSSVTVGLITWGYSQWTENRKSDNENLLGISKIDIEMTNRIVDFENNLHKATNYIAYSSAVYGFLKSAEMPKQAPTQTILNEYENVSTRALLIMLSQLVNDEQKSEIKKIIVDVNKISSIFRNREMQTGEAYNNPLTSEMENEKHQIAKLLEEVKLERWKLE